MMLFFGLKYSNSRIICRICPNTGHDDWPEISSWWISGRRCLWSGWGVCWRASCWPPGSSGPRPSPCRPSPRTGAGCRAAAGTRGGWRRSQPPGVTCDSSRARTPPPCVTDVEVTFFERLLCWGCFKLKDYYVVKALYCSMLRDSCRCFMLRDYYH